jgi:glucose 1-dehydrogenase
MNKERPMGILSNKVAVITGSSRGLGLAIAEAYAVEGASVVLAARSRDALNLAVDGLRQRGFAAAGMVCDTSKREEVEQLADLAVNTFGHLDIWVNNAGTGAPYGPTASIQEARFEQVVNTNILGVYYGSMAALSRFIPDGQGKLINLVGRGAEGPVPLQNAYASSKIWVRSFTLALAKEYAGSGIGIFAFNPGLVMTDMITRFDVIAGYKQKVMPLETVIRLFAKPPEVPAQKALWLASPATDGKTGLNVTVLTPGLMISGAAHEAWRLITRRPSTIEPLQLREIPAC